MAAPTTVSHFTTDRNNQNNSKAGSGSSVPPRIPHIIKWIKHRVNTKKDTPVSGDKKRDSLTLDITLTENSLTSISKETIHSSESTISGSTQDSLDTNTTSYSGNTIVSDSSFERKDSTANNCVNLPITTPAIMCNVNTSFSNASCSDERTMAEHQQLNPQVVTTTSTTCYTRGSFKNHTVTVNNTGTTTVVPSVCKHGSMENHCRLCMQLPPLPPGSERVLKELQRQAKQKLRSQSQIHLTGNENNVASQNSFKPSCNVVNNASNSRFSAPTQTFINTQASITNQTQQPHSNYGFIENWNKNTAFCRSLRSATTSPEHLYEEIPNSFFQDNQSTLSNQRTDSNCSGKKNNSNNKMNFFQIGLKNKQTVSQNDHSSDHQQVRNQSYTMDTHTNSGSNNGLLSYNHIRDNNPPPSPQNAMQLRSHEFYPQNMHYHGNKQQAQQQQKAHSKQVSLGNLDFGMAKECDGFLVVPLRDRMQNTNHAHLYPQHDEHLQHVVAQPPLQNDNNQHFHQHQLRNPVNQMNQSDNIHKHWQQSHGKNQATNNQVQLNQQSFVQHPPSWVTNQSNVPHFIPNQHHVDDNTVNYNSNPANSTPKNQPALLRQSHSHHQLVNHKPSDSGFHEGGVGGSSIELRAHVQHETFSNGIKCKANDVEGQFGLSHIRTHSVDVVGYEPTEKFSHCKKCKRPHPLYHGVSVCHSEVEDMTQELQYLDIAGLEKDKLRSSSALLSSPSLLQNFTARRSAFSKYIPSVYQLSPNNESPTKTNMLQDEKDSVSIENNKIENYEINADAYKRQSMSTESDYFSSNYNTSQSDNVSRTSHDFQTNQTQNSTNNCANYVTGSDRSNDTFSEYDLNSEVSNKHTSNSSEYDYYLAKVQENLRIKQEVKQIIRSSESERSDCDFIPDDSISLTSVTSLSELSTLPLDDSGSFVRLKVYGHKTHNKGSPKSEKSPIKAHQIGLPNDLYVSKMQRVRKPIRKKKKSANTNATKCVEYYKLPNFAQSIYNQPNTELVKSASSTQCNKSPKVSAKYRSSSPSDNSDLKSVYSLDSNMPKDTKLSCRVTDFQLSDVTAAAKSKSAGSGGSGKELNRVASVRAVATDSNVEKILSNRNSVYSSHNQVKSNTNNNRLLSDLMRMNHDRQLFSLI